MINEARPNPDELLARVQADEARTGRGRLKVFFGYAAGVGKTFAMLEAARREKEQGVEVVVGYVEPHGRVETEALLEGLETIPHKQVPYHGVTLREFDLDAALARHPQLLLVDELAHTNAEGCRHSKRWQDVEELLDAGIDVYTTLNVQHVESLNDVIAQITGVVVHETLPDAVLERADEIELIDLTPEELIERLETGKVYLAPQAARALQSFFQKSNLFALREMSLRQAANRLRRDVEAARKDKAATAPWATSERLLVCVGPSPTTARLLRTAKRMSVAFGCEWLAVAVTTSQTAAQSLAAREQVAEHLRLAERLGAETHTLVGDNVPATVLEFARSRNVTKVVVGKTAQPWWQRVLARGIVDQLLEKSGEIDVYVIRGDDGDEAADRRSTQVEAMLATAFDWRGYLQTSMVVGVCGLIGWGISRSKLSETNIVMVFLLGVVFVAARLGRGPAVAASIVSVLVFDFCFVPPHFTFAVSDAQYLLTFAVMLVIGLLISALTARIQSQLQLSRQQERRTAALFRLTRQLSELVGSDFLLQAAGRQLADMFFGEVVIFLRNDNRVELRYGHQTSIAAVPVNAVVAEWVSEHSQLAGVGTDTLPNATALFVPLIGSQQTVGAVGVKSDDFHRFIDPEERRLLETCASLIALAIERDRSLLEVQESQLKAQAEQMRSSLLSSVSHDLRTPLTGISGAASLLAEQHDQLPASQQHELAISILDEADRLNRLVGNLLDLTRLQANVIRLQRELQPIEDVIGVALRRMERQLRDHPVRTNVPTDLPPVPIDEILIQQVLINLLDNATKFAPPGSPIELSVCATESELIVEIADHGSGIRAGQEQRLFDKFVQAEPHKRGGSGLGLAICKGVVELHGGRIEAANRTDADHGAVFRFTLPYRDR